MGYVIKNIDHLGIVAALCKEIELIKEIVNTGVKIPNFTGLNFPT